MSTQKQAKVYLVGAGPGDPDLITMRGLRCLRQADVVLYDRLVHPDLLEYAPRSARLVYVGKEKGHSESQEWIQRLAIAEARKGRVVVRLKGGDPFVFGRGGEEAEALARAGISFEVVPGITSAIAVPALAGIPVLHRNYSSSLTVVSGHQCTPQTARQWATCLRRSGTLVILMGLDGFPRIRSALTEAGVEGEMPLAFISRGATKDEKVVVSTLATAQSTSQDLEAPTLIVIGPVVRLREKLVSAEPVFDAGVGS
ncbi:MAG TPA: uroporphyrinogen-III C-methyltransferase [Acidobacteriota bacterium]|jgi:uroporphyrin-III C-methyltransferase